MRHWKLNNFLMWLHWLALSIHTSIKVQNTTLFSWKLLEANTCFVYFKQSNINYVMHRFREVTDSDYLFDWCDTLKYKQSHLFCWYANKLFILWYREHFLSQCPGSVLSLDPCLQWQILRVKQKTVMSMALLSIGSGRSCPVRLQWKLSSQRKSILNMVDVAPFIYQTLAAWASFTVAFIPPLGLTLRRRRGSLEREGDAIIPRPCDVSDRFGPKQSART